ncbi:MAG: FadR family transcriptional regulator [Planctomycetes bacterium]|nr:FadR family transcriptional regulator [Planctomycetota bacterium]
MDKELLHKKAVREIISLVASGEFKEGKKLPAERNLCERLGISRGTLRKTLADLEKMGVAKIKPQSGAYIQNFSYNKLPKQILPVDCENTSMEDVLVARKAIEVAAIELACKRITKAELKIFDQYIKAMEEKIEQLPEYLSYDIKFHEQIVKSSRNTALITAFEAISEYHKYSQVFSSGYKECEKDALKCHKKILKAISDRDQKRCVRLLKTHLENMI